MFKKILLATALTAALVSPVMAADAAKTPTVAVINLPLIMNEIPQSKDVEAKLAKEFAPRQAELQSLQQKGAQLAQELQSGKYKGDQLTTKQRELAQMQSDFQLKVRAFQEDERKRSTEEQRKIAVEIQNAIDAIAKERGIDLVLREMGIAYTIDSLDISKDVISRVSKAKKK